MNILLRWLINALVIILIARYVPGVAVSGFYAALITALVLGLINAVIRPILVFLTLPITILTLGLFTLVINATLFWFVGTVVQGFAVVTFSAAFIGALILSIASALTNWFLKQS